jgi:hypothetical protein
MDRNHPAIDAAWPDGAAVRMAWLIEFPAAQNTQKIPPDQD